MKTPPQRRMDPTVDVHRSVSAFEEAAAAFIVSHANASIQDRGMCTLVLAGGATPCGIYRRLAADPFRGRVDWSRVHLCFGDERAVPPDDPQSNYGMVKREFLSRVAMPEENVHRIHGESVAEDAAKAYGAELRGLLRDRSGRFDLVLLGVGEDGHTASLFPGSVLLDERTASVRAVYATDLKSWRVTMTLPLLNSARDVLFLVTGKEKAPIVQRILNAQGPMHALPATMVQPLDGNLRWMLDRDAAAALNNASSSVLHDDHHGDIA